MTPLEFSVPNLHMGAMAPILLVFAGATLAMLVEAFAPRRHRRGAQLSLALVTILAAFVTAVYNWALGREMRAAVRSLSVDGPSYFLWCLLLVFGALSLLLFSEDELYDGASVFTPMGVSVPGSEEEREAMRLRVEHTEVFPLALFALAGMMVFVSANDLLTLFVALEVMSLPLYVLAGLARRRRLLSQEAALKYFLLGSLSSALFLYGIALLYGAAGSFNYDDLGNNLVVGSQRPVLMLAGLAFVAIGLLFKIGAVPFHSWTPDVYQGAPTPVTAFFASCTKIAAVGALTRVLFAALGGARWDWQPMLAVIAALTIVVGSVLAVMQTDVKRMLAYSSVAHAGFLLTAIVGAAAYGNGGVPAGQMTSVGAILFYLAAYGFATLGAFAIVTMVRTQAGEANSIASWAGIARRRPFIGLAFSLFLLSFAGIPLTAGFMGKWAVFAAAWRGGFQWLVVVAVLASVIAAYFYLRVLLVMFGEPEADAPTQGDDAVRVARAGAGTWIPVVLGVVATLLLGIAPGPLLDLAMRASQFLR